MVYYHVPYEKWPRWRVPTHFQNHHHVKLIRAGNHHASDYAQKTQTRWKAVPAKPSRLGFRMNPEIFK